MTYLKHRFFVTGTHAAGETVELDGSDAHKIRDVLRMNDGDEFEIIDSAANRYRARLQSSPRKIAAELLECVATQPETPIQITVAQGVPKGQKMDFVVEKLTELGVASIVPLQSERAVVTEVSALKLDRWRRLAKSAALQCGRAGIPEIAGPCHFADLLETFPKYDVVLLPWELADGPPARERLPDLVSSGRRILIAIGPEGGFSHAEAEAASAAGAQLLSLGPRILRTETAALVTVSILSYALGV